jgi:hypothetical protein
VEGESRLSVLRLLLELECLAILLLCWFVLHKIYAQLGDPKSVLLSLDILYFLPEVQKNFKILRVELQHDLVFYHEDVFFPICDVSCDYATVFKLPFSHDISDHSGLLEMIFP